MIFPYARQPDATAQRCLGVFSRLCSSADRHSVVSILTLKRARTYALVTLLIGCAAISAALQSDPNYLARNTDFPAFYNAGRILNEGGNLYDQALQERLYINVVPSTPAHSREIRFYAYAPFFALPFSPLARLPYTSAFVGWLLTSLLLFTAGFRLLWLATPFPDRYFRDAFLIALSFLPFYAWCLAGGQTSAFGFFALALAIYLDHKDRQFFSGLALALLLYKPPLVLFFVPMLLVTGRWKSLLGFALGGIAIGVLSLAVIGSAGVTMYLNMLRMFAELKASGARPTWLEIDLYSQLLMISSTTIATGLLAACLILAGVYLFRAWRSGMSWPITIIASLLLNLYVLLYDGTLAIIAGVLTFASLNESRSALRWLLAALFLAPWFQTHLAQVGIQPVTCTLATLLIYLITQCLTRTRPDHSGRSPSTLDPSLTSQ